MVCLKAKHMDTAEREKRRIGDLEDKLKQRDRTILELRQEAEEAQALISELRDQVQDVHDLLEQWREAFDMELGDNGLWNFMGWVKARDAEREAYAEILRDWNKFVPEYNAAVRARSLGRPLAASEVQQREVLKLRKAGKSLRAIVTLTGLGIRTVRTILGKADGTDRTSKRTNELRKLELNRASMATYRARKRTRMRCQSASMPCSRAAQSW
jgi:hypothetical protein